MAKVEDLTVRPEEYWLERFEALAKRNGDEGDKSLKDLRILFKGATDEMDEEIVKFYGKYGVIESAPTFKKLADGSTVISGISNKLVVPESVAKKPLTKGTRLTSLQNQLNEILKKTAGQQNDLMKATLSGVAQDQYYETFYELYRGVGVGQSFNLLTEPQVLSLIRNEVAGANFSTRVWDNRDKLSTVVNQTLKAGITQGLSNGQMAKAIAEKMGSGRKVAERLLRTEVTNSLNQASLIGYQRSGIVENYEYIATLDDRTSAICTDLDGQVFPTSKAVAGLNFPPMHPNCRSTTAAKFDDSKKGLTRIARGLDGNTFTVPASMSAKDFKAIYVDKTLSRKSWDRKNRK